MVLPSQHEDTELIFTFQGETKRNFLKHRTPLFASCFGDVSCQIQHIKSGLVLIVVFVMIHVLTSLYNHLPPIASYARGKKLKHCPRCWPREEQYLDDDIGTAMDQLDSLGPDLGRIHIYMFEHQYNDDNLHVVDLWGDDFARVKAMKPYADISDVKLFLVQVERSIAGSTKEGPENSFDGIEYPDLDHIVLRRVFNLDGKQVAHSVDVGATTSPSALCPVHAGPAAISTTSAEHAWRSAFPTSYFGSCASTTAIKTICASA